MNFFKNNILAILGVIGGSLAGYFYWKFIGCNSGTCLITSKPINSTIYGAVMGGLILSMAKKTKNI